MQKSITKNQVLFATLILIEVAFVLLLAVSLHEYVYSTTFAVIFVYISLPAIKFLENTCKLPRFFAIGLIFIFLLCIVLAILLVGLPYIAREISSLLLSLPKLIHSIANSINQLSESYGSSISIESGIIEQQVTKFIKNLTDFDANTFKRVMALAQGTANQLLLSLTYIIYLLLIPLLYFFIGIHYDEILDCIEKYTPKKYRAQLSNILLEINNIISSFLRGELLLIASLAICYTIGFHIVGVPYATALGILTGVLSFIPFIGSATGMTISILSLYAANAGIYSFVSLAIVYAITATLESIFFIPYFIGNSVGMSTFTSLIVLIVATKELGAIGLLLGIPIAAIFKYLFLSYAETCRKAQIL
ncbi:MAG: AI-2E family transporter [Pseudomonadota bacterium]|nr:AI-2E family transporter [Pseudomonadota bacterium]